MLLTEIKKQVQNLTINERLELVKDIIQSLQTNSKELTARVTIIKEMKGLLKTAQPTPTDEEIANILVEHKINKYLK